VPDIEWEPPDERPFNNMNDMVVAVGDFLVEYPETKVAWSQDPASRDVALIVSDMPPGRKPVRFSCSWTVAEAKDSVFRKLVGKDAGRETILKSLMDAVWERRKRLEKTPTIWDRIGQ